MARLDQRWLNFSARGAAWWHFWGDAVVASEPPEPPPTTVRRYYRGRPAQAGAVMLSKQMYYVDETA